MADLLDPMMLELLPDFCQENEGLLEQLEVLLEESEENPEECAKKLEKFGQIIDRMMGAAKSIGLKTMATFCELGKVIGYKSGQTKDIQILTLVIAILFDNIDLLKKMNKQLLTAQNTDIKSLNLEAFAGRLQWLSEKFKHIERASCVVDESPSKQEVTQVSIDSLLADLGL